MSRQKGRSQRSDSKEESKRDEIQKLKAIVRNQRKQIQKLRRELGRRSDIADDYQELLNEVESTDTIESAKGELCEKCYRGRLESIDLGARILLLCKQCGSKKTQANTKK